MWCVMNNTWVVASRSEWPDRGSILGILVPRCFEIPCVLEVILKCLTREVSFVSFELADLFV